VLRTRQFCISIFLAFLSPSVLAIPIYAGSGTDAEGDVTDAQFADPTLHDLASVLVEVDESTFFARVLFHGNTYSAQSEAVDSKGYSKVSIGLDLDQDPDTGDPGVDSSGNNADFFGTDILISLDKNFPSIFRFSDTGVFEGRSFLNTGGITELLNGIEVSIPLSLLDNEEGQLNFFVLAQQSRGTSSSTGIVDYMSDIGVQAFGTSRVTTPPPSVVPGPSSIALILLGLPMVFLSAWMKRRRARRRDVVV
jgi:hypothetical protein